MGDTRCVPFAPKAAGMVALAVATPANPPAVAAPAAASPVCAPFKPGGIWLGANSIPRVQK